MKLLDLDEMAKAITAKTCQKCGQPIVDRNYYFYKGGYCHKGGCNGAATTPPAPGTAPVKSHVSRVSRIPSAPAQVDPTAQIKAWLTRHNITNYKIHPDTGVVDVDGDVDLDIDHFTKLPVKFGVVTGSFDVGGTPLTTLEGCPHTVGRTFICSRTDITSFEHGPTTVGRSYIAVDIQTLKSLRGLPRIVPGQLSLDGRCGIANLEGISERIGTLILPETKFSAHNIHKMVKYVRSHINFHKTNLVTHMLGVLFIEGMKDGISFDDWSKQGLAVKKLFDDALTSRKYHEGTLREPKADALPYRDVLDIQEQLIDMGYPELAKL